MDQRFFHVLENPSSFLSSLRKITGGAYCFLVVCMRPAQRNTRWPELRARRPGPQEEGQAAELLGGQFCFDLVAQGGMFPLLDHPGTQQERLHLVSKASRLPHEPRVCWLPC